ncbi:YgeY family selenium metabolism-linked hydrolase [candidate division KSB1 bacterium]
MKNKIIDIADTHTNDIIKFLREITAIPSFSGEEGQVIDRIKSEMEKIGFDDIFVDPLGNLLGRLGSGEKILAFDGHCDTVGIGNQDLWTCDPFKGGFEKGLIFGRGCCDQKGGIASMIYAAKILKEIGIPENKTIWFVVSVLEEEFEGLNWKYIIEEDKIIPNAVILTEPSNLQIRTGHKGRIDIKIRTEGISCHGSTPELGENAIYKMVPIVTEIEQLNINLPEKPVFGKGSVAVTEIKSTAPAINAVADSAEIHLDRRLTSGETLESSIKELEELPSFKNGKAKIKIPAFEVKSYTGLRYNAEAFYATWDMQKDHPLVKSAIKTYQDIFKVAAETGIWNFSTNGVATKGIFDIPTIGFGPGDDKYAHTPDEQIPVDHLSIAAGFYTLLVHNCEI